jgi:hypothetical protein
MLLFLILKTLKSLEVHKTADSAALHLIVRHGKFVCCSGVWILTPC